MSETSTTVNLADLPYRCPQCYKHDKIRDFSSLSTLKHHLREQHGYRSKNSDIDGRTSPLTESLHDQLKSLEGKLKQAKKNEEKTKHNINTVKNSNQGSSSSASSPVRPKLSHKVPMYNPSKAQHDVLPGIYQSNYLIRNAPQYLAPHKFAPYAPYPSGTYTNLPPTYDVQAQRTYNQKDFVPNKNIKDNSFEPKVILGNEEHADETLSKMLDKTEGNLSALKLQVESNMHPQMGKNMVHTLNTARRQVENLRKTAEKITSEQQGLIEQLQMQLKNRDDQMNKAKKELDKLRADSNKLRKDLDDKEKKTTQTEEELEVIKTFLEEKEERIGLKERELDELSDFVRSASAHEAQARDKLENFISSILDRAQQAEEEVHGLKAQLSLTPLVQSRNSTPLFNPNQYVPPAFSPLNSTFRPSVHSTPAPPLNNTSQFISPMPSRAGHTTPINTNQALNSPLLRLSPGQVVANLHGSLVDPRSPSQCSAYSMDSVIRRSDVSSQQRSTYQASPVWSDIDRTPIQSPVIQSSHLVRNTPKVASPLTLDRPYNENGKSADAVFPKYLHSPRTDRQRVNSIHSNEMQVPFRPEATFRPVEISPLEQEAVEEIIKPVGRSRNKRFSPSYFSIDRAKHSHHQGTEVHQNTNDQYYYSPRRAEPVVSDASIQTVPIQTVSEKVGTSPQLFNFPQADTHTSRSQNYPNQIIETPLLMVPNYQQQEPVQVQIAPARTVYVPVAGSVNQDYQPVQLNDQVPFIVPSIPNHGFQSPLTHSVQTPAMNGHIPYEELTGFALLEDDDDDVHIWVDSQNRMFPQDVPQHVLLQSQPDISVPPFPGYVLPDKEVYTSVKTQRKVQPYGTSDSGIGSNPSSRATVHGPVPNQYNPMATVLEDSTGQHTSLGVDEHGILWENERYSATSPTRERRNGKRRTYPSFNSNDQQLITNWNTRMAAALESENRELKERLRSLQKKQKHIRAQRKMAAAQGLATDTELSQESESEFLTAEESSEIEESDVHDNNTDENASEEKDYPVIPSKFKRQAERQHLIEQLLGSKEQRNRDALFCVFMYLDTKTLSRISEVCRDWREISRHPALWRRLEFTHARMSSKHLKTISGWCTQLQSLSLECLKGRRKLPKESNDEYLCKTRGCLEEGFEHLLSASQNTLISLKIIDCGNILTDRCLYLSGCYSRLLQRVVYISDSHPAGPEAIWTLGAGCRNITTLIIPPLFPSQKPRRFDNGCVKRIGKCWPNMRVVCIGGIEVNTKGLISLVTSCPRLNVLELDHMCEIGEDDAKALCSAGLKGLEEVDFTFTPVTPKAILYFISACPQLKSAGVHIGISDYFDDPTSTRSRQHYKEIVSKLNSLRKRPGVKDILQIKTDYG